MYRNLILTSAAAALSVMIAAIGPAAASHPSYNCDNAGNLTERTICGSNALAKIDRNHARLYRDTLDQAERTSDRRARTIIRDAERHLLRERDSCGRDEWCIRDVYAQAGNKMRKFLRQLD